MVYFSNIFDIDQSVIDSYGALDVSLVNDLPLFIDPFLLFGSSKDSYQELHREILRYVGFLKSKSANVTEGELQAWYMFPEVRQNWLGYCLVGNSGRGLGKDFAIAFSSNLDNVFGDLGEEKISKSSHIEKVALFNVGVGKDNISDFTTNLIKGFLLDYTEKFAVKYLDDSCKQQVMAEKAYFDYNLERWMPKSYTLPYFNNDYILLTPKDILSKDDTWINRADLNNNFRNTVNSIGNSRLRAEIDNYFIANLPKPDSKKSKKRPTKSQQAEAIAKVLSKYPELIDYYIRFKETTNLSAKATASSNVSEIKKMFVENVTELIESLNTYTDYFKVGDDDSYLASLNRVKFLKQVIENNDGYKLFYHKGEPLKREADIQVIFRLTWFSTKFDVNSETNNGRGPVDYKISNGSKDKTLVEFKLASNSKIEQNLENQVEVYSKANETKKNIKVILYFNSVELQKVNNILNRLKLGNSGNIILINAGKSGKESASNVKST